jgi:lipopolysaccharide biosynthesis regulator YciM
MESGRRRVPSEVLKRGYSDEEIGHLYELGRLFLEHGDLRRAEVMFIGISEVAADFAPAWLGIAYIHIQNKNFDGAITAAAAALRIMPDSVEAMLFLISCQLTTGDYNSAGTYLGEIGERIESGLLEDPNLIRFYKAQMVRYGSR